MARDFVREMRTAYAAAGISPSVWVSPAGTAVGSTGIAAGSAAGMSPFGFWSIEFFDLSFPYAGKDKAIRIKAGKGFDL